MKKKISQLVMSLMLAITLCIPYPVQAFFGGGLHLTDDQKAELREIGEVTWEAIAPLIEELTTLRDELEALLVAGEAIDVPAVDAINESMVAVRSEILSIQASAKLQSAQVLTLEQREMIINKLQAIREKMEKRREKREQRREEHEAVVDLSF